MFFDIGDVLEVNLRTGWPERWAAHLGMTPDQLEQTLGKIWAAGSVGELSLEGVEGQIAVTFRLDEPAVRELMDDVWEEYVGTLNHELADYFAGLRPAYRTGIVSNSVVGAREREQEAHRLGELCDVIVYSHEEGCLKPDPQIYRIACERLAVAPHSAVLLDDLDVNAEGARAVGMNAIVYRNNAEAISQLRALLAR